MSVFNIFRASAASGLALIGFQLATPEAYAQEIGSLGRNDPRICRTYEREEARAYESRQGRATSRAAGRVLGGVLGGRDTDKVLGDLGRGVGDAARGRGQDAARAQRLDTLWAQCQEARQIELAGQCTTSSRQSAVTPTYGGQASGPARGVIREDQNCRSSSVGGQIQAPSGLVPRSGGQLYQPQGYAPQPQSGYYAPPTVTTQPRSSDYDANGCFTSTGVDGRTARFCPAPRPQS